MNNFFQLFQLPEQFDTDTSTLEQRYRTLSAQFHPDKFLTASSFEQKQAMMMSASLNEAYRTLSQPLERAVFLLKKQEIDPDAPENTRFPTDFLMQQMQWREQLADATTPPNPKELNQLKEEIQQQFNPLLQQLQEAFAQQQWQNASQLVQKGRFLNKLLQEINAVLD